LASPACENMLQGNRRSVDPQVASAPHPPGSRQRAVYLGWGAIRLWSVPGSPWSRTAFPKPLQVVLVPQCIHGLPEPRMSESSQLAVRGKLAKGRLFPSRLIPIHYIVECLGLQDEESSVYEGRLALRLFIEALNQAGGAVVDGDDAEPARRSYSCEGGESAVAPMEPDECGDVDIRDSIAIGHAEGIVCDMVTDTSQPAACHSVEAGLDHGDLVILGGACKYLIGVVAQVEGYVAVVDEVIVKETGDDVSLVTRADNELIYPMVPVHLHNVPDDGLASYLHHGFRLQSRFLGNSGTQPTGKNHCFHKQNDFHFGCQAIAVVLPFKREQPPFQRLSKEVYDTLG
jgi:hypothetical protein